MLKSIPKSTARPKEIEHLKANNSSSIVGSIFKIPNILWRRLLDCPWGALSSPVLDVWILPEVELNRYPMQNNRKIVGSCSSAGENFARDWMVLSKYSFFGSIYMHVCKEEGVEDNLTWKLEFFTLHTSCVLQKTYDTRWEWEWTKEQNTVYKCNNIHIHVYWYGDKTGTRTLKKWTVWATKSYKKMFC